MFSRRHFLQAGAGLGAAMMLTPGFSALTGNTPRLKAGVGRASVELAGLYPLGDFVAEHDPLFTRVLLLEQAGQRQAIVVIDLTSITPEVIARMKPILLEVTGVRAENAIINASHSFSTPHISTPTSPETATTAVLSAFESALRRAATQAINALQPARIGTGNGISKIGVNRNINTPHGWWLGADDSGYSDPHVGVICLSALDGQPLAILINYAVQPAVMDASQQASGGRLVSADLAGAVSRYVENHYAGAAVAFYLVGCAGDQVPYLQASRHVVHQDGSVGRIDIHEKGFVLLDAMAQRLGDEVIRVADRVSAQAEGIFRIERLNVSVNAQTFSPHNAPTGPVKMFHYHTSGVSALPVVMMQWGNSVLVGVQPELSACLGAHIRAQSPFSQTFVMTMVDGAAKYLPERGSYQRFTYEARSSPFAPGAGEVAANAIIAQLRRMQALPA